MTWGNVIVAGGAVVGGAMASDSASSANKAASKSSKRQLAFEKQKYDDWKETYGGIEENLADYYGSLTPEYYEAQGLEAFQKEQQRSMDQVKTTLAQRGIEDSGIALAAEISSLQTGATERARIRATAPSMAAEEQRGFLQVGLGQNPGESYSRSLADKASRDATEAAVASKAAGEAVGTAVTTVGTGLADYFSKPAVTPPPVDPYFVGPPAP